MYTLFGLSGQHSLNSYESFLNHLHDDDRERVFFEVADALEKKTGFESEYRIIWPDSSLHHIASRAQIVYEDLDSWGCLIGVCWDITERKRLDKLKSEFVSTVSHELRTPLTSITGALGLAVSGALCELPDKARHILEIAYKNGQRLKLLINDLLDMDKLLAGKLEFHCEPQLVLPLVERSIAENKSYADQYHVTFVLKAHDGNQKINVEDLRFLQIMSNYLSNAAKFSPATGEVNVVVEPRDEWIRIAVQDCGSGIPEDAQKHIFEKFYQADSSDSRAKGGTGLGLAITKEIAERMGGVVGFTSIPGAGSTFYVDFPIVA